MYGANLRAYGEYFAEAQAITTSAVAGNKTENNPTRLDAAQGGTAIVVATEKATGSLVVANNATITLTVKGAKTEANDNPVVLGTAVYTNDTGAAKTFNADAKVLEFILPDACLKYPYVSVAIQGSAAPTGKVDIFPHYISHPRRG